MNAQNQAGDGGQRADVELRLPADSAYVLVLRTAAAGLAARLDFPLDDIEDIRTAVDELAKASSAMGSALYADQAAAGGAAGGDSGSAAEDVVDAEIVDEDK